MFGLDVSREVSVEGAVELEGTCIRRVNHSLGSYILKVWLWLDDDHCCVHMSHLQEEDEFALELRSFRSLEGR
jgi:hypothetical protein